MVNVRKSLARGTAWIAGARAVTNALGFASTLVLARLLTPDDFGLVALATTMLAILTSLTDLSLTSALVQHKAPAEHHFHAAWTLQFLRNTFLSAAFAAASFPAAAFFAEPRLVGVMFALAVSIFIQGLSNPRSIMLTRDLVFWQQFMMQVGSKIATLLVATAIAYVYRSYWALVWSTIAGQIVSLALSYTVLPFRPRPQFRGARELIGFSVWLTLGQMINTINWKSDQIFIGGYLGRPALGFYSVGDNLAIMPTRELTSPITQTLFPAFSRVSHDPDRLRSAYQKSQAVVTALALPAGVGTALVAHPLVLLTMGAKWLPVVFVIQVLASVFAFQSLGSLSQPLAMATGNTRLLFRRDLQGFLMRLPTIVAGMLIAGLPGIIYARAITGFLAIILHMQVVKKVTGLTITEQFGANKRAITSVISMGLAVGALSHFMGVFGTSTSALALRLAILATAGAVTYLAATAVLWVWASRPDGHEKEILAVGKRMVAKFATFL